MYRAQSVVINVALLSMAMLPACGPSDESPSANAAPPLSATSASRFHGGSESSALSSSGGEDLDDGEGGQGDLGSSGGKGDLVTGTSFTDWIGEGAPVRTPDDLSAATIEALVQKGGGQRQTITGQGFSNGTFIIPSVPHGPYLFHIVRGGASTYLDTSARVLDLGSEIGGRPDAIVPEIAPTNLIHTMSDLAPWQDGDDIEYFVGNTNAWTSAFFGLGSPDNPPAPGDTSLRSLTLDWTNIFGPALIDSAKGDVLTLLQLSAKTGASGTPYSVATRFASFGGITQADGVDTALTGAFSAITLDKTISLDLRPSEFAACAHLVNPKAESQGLSFFIDVMPGGGTFGQIGSTADLLQLSVPAGSADANLGSVAYGNPFPAAWGAPFGLLVGFFSISYTAPGATTSAQRTALLLARDDAARFGAAPLRPLLSPVRSLKVNGKSAFSDLTGVTKTPTLSWAPPSVGAPTAYAVRILKIANVNGATKLSAVARLITKHRKVKLPPGILTDGSTYFAEIQALVRPIDPTVHPLRSSVLLVQSQTDSNSFTP
jgi:hypothetical protein